MLAKTRFSLILSTALSLFMAQPALSFEDDLMLDMGLTEEAPAPQKTTPTSTQTQPKKNNTFQLATPTPAPKVTPPPAPKQKARKHKSIVKGLDFLTRVKNGMNFNIEELENWVMGGNEINQCMENGKTLLIYLATKHSDYEAVRYLIDNGADMQTHCFPKYEVLFEALKENKSSAVIETLINNNANIVATDENKNNALIIAATYNQNPDMISILQEYGLKIDTKNQFGQDALTLASFHNGRIPMLQKLIDNGANVNSRDNNGHTPLMAAAVSGNDIVMQYLIKRGADFNAVDNQGVSVLDYYTKKDYLKTLDYEENQYATISEKLDDAYKFIAENHLKYNQALLESLKDHDDIEDAIDHALTHNADVDILDSTGCTPLLSSIKEGRPTKIISRFISGKADVNATCYEGKNAFMLLFSQENQTTPLPEQIEKIKLLQKNNINPNTKDNNGNNALHYALKEKAAPGIVEALINADVPVNATNNAGETPLMTAIKANAPEKSTTVLLENEANPDIADNSGITPLWYLLNNNGNPNLLQVLLEYGANIEAPNAAGTVPLWYVLENPVNEQLQTQIISTVSDTNIPNSDKDTPLLYALKNGFSPNVIQALLANGANPTIKGKDGRNAYEILKSNQFFNEAMKIHTREHVLDNWE